MACRIFSLFTLIALSLPVAAHASTGEKISIADAPWSVSLRSDDFYHGCGGTLIAPRWIVTAGHCVDWFDEDRPVGDQMSVWGGHANLKKVVRLPRIKAVYLAPGFVNEVQKVKFFKLTIGSRLVEANDVGLIELESDAVLPEQVQESGNKSEFLIRPANIAETAPHAGSEIVYAGWGIAPKGTPGKRTKEKVNYDLRSFQDAYPGEEAVMAEFQKDRYTYYREIRKMQDQPETLTTLSTKATCQGDSGSGLFTRGPQGTLEITAVTTGGTEESCTRAAPQSSTFTRLAPFRAWISKLTR